jgi:transmembrane sensor
MKDHNRQSDPLERRAIAVDWWVRQKTGSLSKEEEAAFEAWLRADPRNRVEYDDISDFGGFLATVAPPAVRHECTPVSTRYRRLGAATLAIAALASVLNLGALLTFLRSDFRTGVGESKFVTLEDGSRIQLAPKSAIALRNYAGQRRLALLEGEAWFEVAPDKERPFVVEASGGAVTALGTAFDVALEDGGARVTVTQHRVEISSGGGTLTVDEGSQSAYARDRAARQSEPVDLTRAIAWRRGKFILDNKPLGEVLTEIGRYRHGYVYCLSASTCARRVSGVFDVGDPLQMLIEMEASLGLRATHLSNYLILLHE